MFSCGFRNGKNGLGNKDLWSTSPLQKRAEQLNILLNDHRFKQMELFGLLQGLDLLEIHGRKCLLSRFRQHTEDTRYKRWNFLLGERIFHYFLYVWSNCCDWWHDKRYKSNFRFKPFKARKALQALRGLVRLKSLVESAAVKRQTTNTLRTMQGMSRVQSLINSRRIRMLEENQVLQRQLLRKRAKELESLQASIIKSNCVLRIWHVL